MLEKKDEVVEFIEVAIVELRGVAQPRDVAELRELAMDAKDAESAEQLERSRKVFEAISRASPTRDLLSDDADHMRAGVTMRDPSTAYIEPSVTLAADEVLPDHGAKDIQSLFGIERLEQSEVLGDALPSKDRTWFIHRRHPQRSSDAIASGA